MSETISLRPGKCGVNLMVVGPDVKFRGHTRSATGFLVITCPRSPLQVEHLDWLIQFIRYLNTKSIRSGTAMSLPARSVDGLYQLIHIPRNV